jgi:hypothetical protein
MRKLEDAAPIFAQTENLPGTGVLLALLCRSLSRVQGNAAIWVVRVVVDKWKTLSHANAPYCFRIKVGRL